MKIQYELGNEGRKPLVKAVGEAMSAVPKYLGALGFCYEVAGIVIDKDGVLDVPNTVDTNRLTTALKALGFERKEDAMRFCVEFPLDGFDDTASENLEKLIESKAVLIRKALNAYNLSVQKTADRLRFDWFSEVPSSEEVHAYTSFISKLCEQAKRQQRVTGKAVDVENEKYAFRCFLLKLGFIGEEYKVDRKILLARLSGNAAFKRK